MEIEQFIKAAIQEDVHEGDHTSLACIPSNKKGKAELITKENGVIAGIELAETIFKIIDPEVEFDSFYRDGELVEKRDLVLLLKGNLQSILKGERLMLNFMQRMSGIASLTRKFVKSIDGYPAKILDTRKTTPGFRFFEKWAVRIGGGVNHRIGLYDMMMIKDNHISYAGGIAPAIKAANDYLKKNNLNLRIEIETTSIEQVEEVLSIGNVDRIMLDNFKIGTVRKAVKIINKRIETEVSGGINLENARDYAACEVDYISVGALTHSYKSLDLSLKAI